MQTVLKICYVFLFSGGSVFLRPGGCGIHDDAETHSIGGYGIHDDAETHSIGRYGIHDDAETHSMTVWDT